MKEIRKDENKAGKGKEGNLNIEHSEGEVERKDGKNTCNEEEGFMIVQRKKRRIAFEKFVKVENIFKKVDNMSDKELEEIEKKEKRFTRGMEKYVITARLKKEQSTNNKNTNILKIAKRMKKDGVKPERMLENSFTAMELEFTDMNEANKCLEIMDQGNGDVMYSIKGRAIQCRGVIAS